MIRILTKWWAKLSYLWALETEAHKSLINADTAKVNADEKRRLVAQLNAEADEIEANIKDVEAQEEVRKSAPEYRAFTPKEQYDDQQASKAEKDAAVQVMNEKRELAKAESAKVSEAEQVAQVLRGRANDSRSFADKIRAL
jgi:predicted  nucleic acid-binding Zn-ribbon protein